MINMSNNETVKIAISGGMGKMGLLLSDFIENKDGYDISGIYDPGKESDTYHNYKSIDEINADILVEFSPANSINENLSVLANMKINLVVGSSGINESSLEVLQSNIDDDQFICIIPNFSIGASFQKIFSGLLNKNFPEVSIEERHHSNKKDSPSGTAVDMAQSLDREERSSTEIKESSDFDENVVNEINIQSLRSDKYIAEQTVTFSTTDESISIDHKVTNRTAYLEGIGYILDIQNELKGFHHGLENIMIERFKV
tara:strand:+ start:8350 stop:9120 length:771 start_codon:yes stop_codon:yes gene_type:complete